MEKYDLKKGDKVIFVSIIGPRHFDYSGIFIFNGKSGTSANHGFYYEVSSENRLTNYPAYHAEILPLKYLDTELERIIYGYEDPVS